MNAAPHRFSADESDRQSATECRSQNTNNDSFPRTISQLSELDLRTVALLLANNVAGGAASAQNSYRLMQAYVWDDEARASIDRIVEEYHRRAGST